MKILFASDVHGRFNLLEDLIKSENPNFVYLCGDTEIKKELLPNNVLSVRGNCDCEFDLFHKFNLNNQAIIITHGHTLNVKTSDINLFYFAKENGADIVFFGHTHIYTDVCYDGVRLINPGCFHKDKTYVLYDGIKFIKKRM